MTVRIYPAPQTPGYGFRLRLPEPCEVCADRRRVTLCRPGLPMGRVVDCPACTLSGARELSAGWWSR